MNNKLKYKKLRDVQGNVLAVVSDTKNADGTAKIVSASDNYPFGMMMPARSLQSEGYRYGFGGHEKDDEISGNGNHLAFGDYGYDTRLGRRWNIDPVTNQTPSWTPYRTFFNNPTVYIDADGRKEFITIITQNEKTGKTKIEQKTANRLMTDGKRRMVGSNATWHYENDYYDFNTVILNRTDANGNTTTTTTSMMTGKPKDSDYVWFGGNSNGDTKFDVDSWMEGNEIGGFMIYGNASSNQESPGTKVSTDKVWGSFDFAAFSEIMGLVTQSASAQKDLQLDPTFDGMLNRAAELVLEQTEKEKTSVSSPQDAYCTTCGRTFGKDRKTEVSDDKKTPKDTIDYKGHQ